MFVRRVSAVVLALALAAGNAVVCAGWAATPQARMACCSDGNSCPMHQSAGHGSGSRRVLTQAQADSCCASSERQQPDSSGATAGNSISLAVLGPAIVVPVAPPALVLTDGWRTTTPPLSPPIPRHVLFSVFLV